MLAFQNVTIYEKKKTIIHDMDLELPDGVIFGLMGDDQAGKTALLQAASGSKKPDKGSILLDGTSIYQSPDAYLRIGYLPKNKVFYEQLSVEEYFDLFLALYKVNGRYRERRIEEVLDLLEMKEYRDTFLGEIPVDMKPFISLGKSILHEPSWLFLDNPFEDISNTYRKRMVDYLSMLWEQGISLVISTQLFPEITSFFSDVAIISEGQMVMKGTLDSVYKKALSESPIRMKVMDGMEQALRVLRENDLVERVTVDKEDVILLFSGGDVEEAQLLTQLVQAGALVHSFVRDSMDLDQIIWR